jgi:hypothetical protein
MKDWGTKFRRQTAGRGQAAVGVILVTSSFMEEWRIFFDEFV